jgi:gliding motility-associated-like protein
MFPTLPKRFILKLLLVVLGFTEQPFSYSQCCSNGINLLENYNPIFSDAYDAIPPGFQTDNIYSDFLGAGYYSVIIDRAWGACTQTPQFDHTSGNYDGDFLWFDTSYDASPTNPDVAWTPYDPLRPPGEENTIDVTPNTNYVFSVWIRDLGRNEDCITGGAPIMGLRINGVDLAEIDLEQFTEPCCPAWVYLCSEWNSGNSTTALIQVESRTGDGWTDLGIDDVYFGTTAADFEGILGNDISTCLDENFILSPDLIGAQYLWSDQSSNDSLFVTEPGLYWVEIQQGGCSGSDSILISISNTIQPIDLGEDIILCENATLQIEPDVFPPGDYLWQDGTTNESITITESGLYWLQITSNCGNTGDSVNVAFSPLPQIILPPDTTICSGSDITIQATVWNANNINWSNNTSESYIVIEEAGTYSLQASNGCGTITENVVVDYFESGLVMDWDVQLTENDCGSAVEIAAQFTGSGAQSLLWSNGSNANQVQFSHQGPQDYLLQLTATDLCNSEEILQQMVALNPIAISGEIVMPNIFSPNNDGKNEIFLPFTEFLPNEALTSYNLKIYNRWGQLVFETSNPREGWNGKAGNGKSPEGTYFYIAEFQLPCDQKTQSIEGNVTLVR